MEKKFITVYSNKIIYLQIILYLHRIEISHNLTFIMVCYALHSIVNLLTSIFELQSRPLEVPKERTVK